MLYVDHAATSPLRPEARQAMAPFLDDAYGNPSGIHEVSRRAKNALEEAREQAAELIGATRPLEVVFTGGGTEADNLALQGVALGGNRRGVVVSAIEHEAVLETARFLSNFGCPVAVTPVDVFGRVDVDDVTALADGDTALVSIMSANNETGVTQSIRKIAEVVRATDEEILVHTDAVQSFVSDDVTVASTGADLITLASHKFGGPKGVGMLYIRDGVNVRPHLHGGGQELGRRSGTHNVAGIVGMVAAMKVAAADRGDFTVQVGRERDDFEQAIGARFEDAEFSASSVERLVQHSHLRIPGVGAETMLIRLDREGVAASAGSACQSGATEISHVLAAMGVDGTAAGEYMRFTFGWTSRRGDGIAAATKVIALAEELR